MDPLRQLHYILHKRFKSVCYIYIRHWGKWIFRVTYIYIPHTEIWEKGYNIAPTSTFLILKISKIDLIHLHPAYWKLNLLWVHMSIYTGTRYTPYLWVCLSQFVVKSSQEVGLRDRVAIIRTLISPPLILTRALLWRGLLVEEGRRWSFISKAACYMLDNLTTIFLITIPGISNYFVSVWN